MDEMPYTILCVDDEVNILSAMKRLLRRDPYQVLTATSGREALKILEHCPVHLIISDQRMPEMGGTELLAIVKKNIRK